MAPPLSAGLIMVLGRFLRDVRACLSGREVLL